VVRHITRSIIILSDNYWLSLPVRSNTVLAPPIQLTAHTHSTGAAESNK